MIYLKLKARRVDSLIRLDKRLGQSINRRGKGFLQSRLEVRPFLGLFFFLMTHLRPERGLGKSLASEN